ncbi:MAG: hypothetical protein BWX95_00843 [Bacteroidetes bacterium ADurb.Bin141]|nr:MAG: hypothetical protein BWX95_00843 [Bacteroidetes bacterium ADurb.Bin141]
MILDTSYSPRILQAHCQSPASPSTNLSFVKELAKPTQDKIVFKKISRPFKKNKKRHPQPDTNRQENTRTMTSKTQSYSYFQTRWTRTKVVKSVFASCRAKCLNSSAVFQLNFRAGLSVLCPEIPHKHKAVNRWHLL